MRARIYSYTFAKRVAKNKRYYERKSMYRQRTSRRVRHERCDEDNMKAKECEGDNEDGQTQVRKKRRITENH